MLPTRAPILTGTYPAYAERADAAFPHGPHATTVAPAYVPRRPIGQRAPSTLCNLFPGCNIRTVTQGRLQQVPPFSVNEYPLRVHWYTNFIRCCSPER